MDEREFLEGREKENGQSNCICSRSRGRILERVDRSLSEASNRDRRSVRIHRWQDWLFVKAVEAAIWVAVIAGTILFIRIAIFLASVWV